MVQVISVLHNQYTYSMDSLLTYNSQWPGDLRHRDLEKTPDDMSDATGD